MKYSFSIKGLLFLPLIVLALAFPASTSAQTNVDVDEIAVSELSAENRALIPVDCPRGMTQDECTELENLREFILKHTQIVLGRKTSAVHYFAFQRENVNVPARLYLGKELQALRGIKHNIEKNIPSTNRRLLNRRNLNNNTTVRDIADNSNKTTKNQSSSTRIPEYGRNSIIPPGMRTVGEANQDRDTKTVRSTKTSETLLLRRSLRSQDRTRNILESQLEEKSIRRLIDMLDHFIDLEETVRNRGDSERADEFVQIQGQIRDAICEREPDARRGVRQTGDRVCINTPLIDEQETDVPLELQLDNQ